MSAFIGRVTGRPPRPGSHEDPRPKTSFAALLEASKNAVAKMQAPVVQDTELEKIKKRRGFFGSILTSNSGIETKPNLFKTTLG